MNTSGFVPAISSGSQRHWLRSRVPTTTLSSPLEVNYTQYRRSKQTIKKA